MEGLNIELSKDKQIRDVIKEVGLNPNLISTEIISRLKILNEGSETFKDEIRAAKLAKILFNHYEKISKEKAFDPKEQNAVLVGTLFSDIGKTGPSDASPELSKCILSMYKIDAHFNTNIVDIKTFLEMFFDKTQEEKYLKILESNGISQTMAMREFFNKHSKWTLDILKKGEAQGVPNDAIVAASSHHMLEGMNPVNVANLSRASKMVILLDKYDARLRRGTATHEEAISWLRDYINERSSAEDKQEFLELLDSMESSFVNNDIYENVDKVDNGQYHIPVSK